MNPANVSTFICDRRKDLEYVMSDGFKAPFLDANQKPEGHLQRQIAWQAAIAIRYFARRIGL